VPEAQVIGNRFEQVLPGFKIENCPYFQQINAEFGWSV
jgi:hypothetical protein